MSCEATQHLAAVPGRVAASRSAINWRASRMSVPSSKMAVTTESPGTDEDRSVSIRLTPFTADSIGNRHQPFDFLGRQPRAFRLHDDLRWCKLGKDIPRRLRTAAIPPTISSIASEQHDQAIPQRELDQLVQHG